MPAFAYAEDRAEHPAGRSAGLRGRNFDRGRRLGRLRHHHPSDQAAGLTLVTASDGPSAWLAAGQALQRMLLLAAQDWMFAAIYSQPLELPYVRALLARELSVSVPPQLLLRLGYAHTAAATPRRPVSEVLLRGPDEHRPAPTGPGGATPTLPPGHVPVRIRVRPGPDG